MYQYVSTSVSQSFGNFEETSDCVNLGKMMYVKVSPFPDITVFWSVFGGLTLGNTGIFKYWLVFGGIISYIRIFVLIFKYLLVFVQYQHFKRNNYYILK